MFPYTTFDYNSAANGQNEVANGNTVTATTVGGSGVTVTDGLIESTQTASTSITIDSNGAAVVIGNNTTPNDSFTLTESTGSTTQGINVTTSSSANGVTFADDLVVSSTNFTNSITVTATNDNVTFQGNATTSGGGTNSIAVVGGTGGSTLSLTFDTANAENIIFDASITASNAGDTITMNVNNSNGGANTIAFSQSIGATAAINILNIGASTTATFSDTVVADTTNISSTNTTTFNGTVTGNIDFAANGTIGVGNSANITGAITNTTTNQGTLTLLGTTTVSGAVGSTGVGLSAINAGTGTATFSSDVKTTLLSTNGSGGIALNGNFTGDLNVNTGNSATITIATGKNFTGTITNTTTNQGTLTLLGTTTVSGAVGSTGAGLATINAGTGTSTFSNDVTTTLMSTNGSGSIVLNGNFTGTLDITSGNAATITLADGKNFTGTITNATTDQGTLNVVGTSTFSGDVGSTTDGLNAVNIQGSGKTATFAGDLKATTTTIDNLATLKFSKASTSVTGAISSSGTGTLDVGTADVTVSGAVTLGASATLNITIGDNNGSIIATSNGISLQSGTTLVPTITGSITSGQAITIIQSNGVVTIPTVTDNNLRLNLVASQSSNNLILTATTVSSSALGLTGTTAEVNDIVDTAFSGDTLLDALNGLSSNAKLSTALETLIPDVNGGAVIGAVSSGRAPLNTVSYRLASLRTGLSAGQGLSAGDEVGKGKNFWLQGFGTYVDQSERQGIQGFEASTGGFAFGADKQTSNTFLLGLAASYSYTDVNSRLSENQTYINSYQGTVYGTYDFGNNYLNAQFGLAYNDYTGNRFISVGAVDRQANADYEGYQVLTKFELGRDLTLPNEFEFTPSLGLFWAHVEINDYTETGAGASNLIVNDQDYDILNLSLRGELRRTWDINQGSLTPEVHLGYNYEAIDDQIQTVAAFTGGGNTFQSTGFDPANHSATGGAGLTYSSNNFDLVTTYGFEAKKDFVSHSALLKGRWNF
ncbi:MAG: autotransporter domain-containing protein [Nitrospinae bacterium]|nr:autotransporter domain-containing protein [Nitrospinota bacterium]